MSKQLPDTLEARYAEVCGRIADAAAKAGRKASEVILVAVTKNAEPEQIRAPAAQAPLTSARTAHQVLIQHAAIVDEAIQRMKMLPSARPCPIRARSCSSPAAWAQASPRACPPRASGT
jgi:hypothetical protein